MPDITFDSFRQDANTVMTLSLDANEQYLQRFIDDFNILAQRTFPEILQYSHHDLASKTTISDVSEWKNFLVHAKVAEWYKSEMEITAKSRIFKLINNIGTSRSTADTQTLLGLMKQLGEQEEASDKDPTIFIYSFVPLTELEEQAPNVRTLQNIPPSIKDALKKV